MKIPRDLCAIWEPRRTHNDLWKRDPLKLYATSVILKRATSECNCEEKRMELAPKLTYLAQIHRDTRARVRPHTYTHILFHFLSYVTLMQETAWLRHPGPPVWSPFTWAWGGIHSFILMVNSWPVWFTREIRSSPSLSDRRATQFQQSSCPTRLDSELSPPKSNLRKYANMHI